jgi:hypothetical protein
MSWIGNKWWSFRKWLDDRRVHQPKEGERVVLLLVAMAVAIFWSGTFMGIASLQNVWAMEKVYIKECANINPSRQPAINVLLDAKCEKQAVKLLLLSSVISGVTYAFFCFAGIFTDWLGARRVFGVVVLLLIIGNLIAIIPGYTPQFIGTVVISAAAPSLAFTLIMWAQLYPKWTRWAVSIMASAIPAGSVFLGTIRAAYLHAHFSVSGYFALWLIVSIPTITLFIIWPRGIGKPYAAAHPLLMLAHFQVLKRLFQKWGWQLPEDPNPNNLVELEEAYANKEVSLLAKALEEDIEPISNEESDNAPSEEPEAPVSVPSNDKNESSRDIEQQIKVKLRESNWVTQLSAGTIVCLQLYFLAISGWIAILSALGNYRLSYWAEKIGGEDEYRVSSDIAYAKSFLVHLDLINGISIFFGPIAALAMRSIGIPGLAVIIHILVTATAALAMVHNWMAQILTFILFPIIRGLLYPFILMLLIQTCGRKHLGLIWGITISGEGATDFMRTLFIQWSKWIYDDKVWPILNIFQLVVVCVLWVWPIFVWIKYFRTWREKQHDTLT